MTPADNTPDTPLYADVALVLPVSQLYTYLVPDELRENVKVGCVVSAPVRNRAVRGIVAVLRSEPPTVSDTKKKVDIKPLAGVITSEFYIDPDLTELALWMADYYVCSPGEALRTVSFIGLQSISRRTKTLY
jgi:primosomal protein N' (replication factor Y)